MSGVILTLDATLFLWYSSKQTITALSSSEAELIALCEANKKIRLFNSRDNCCRTTLFLTSPIYMYHTDTIKK